MKKEYDYLIVGAGLFGATFAWMAGQHGARCLAEYKYYDMAPVIRRSIDLYNENNKN